MSDVCTLWTFAILRLTADYKSNKLKFIVVDDDSEDRELFGEAVYEIGSSISVETEWSAVQALEKLNADVVLPDIILSKGV